MPTILSRTGAVLRRLLCFATGALMAGIVMLVAWQVLARYVLDVPTFESAELTRLMFIWLTFLGSALLISRQELIAIDLLHGALGERAQHVLSVFNDVVVAVTLVIIGRDSIQLLALIGPKTAPATGLSYRWFYFSLLAFCCIGLFFIVERLATHEHAGHKGVPAVLATAKETLK
jgi:TRAP-type transport system small permease protein